MSISVCASCLSRLRISTPSAIKLPAIAVPIAASFSTTPSQQNVVKKKSNAAQPAKFRETRSARIKKKTKERPKPPAPGERRNQRKRIVLSNTNALEVPDLQHLSPENMADPAMVGKMLALNGPLLDQLRECKAFKTTQNWSMFRQPSTLMRQETIELGQDIKEVMSSQQDQGFGALSIQKIITGDRGSGKSIHLLQAQSMAFLNGWIVITIPECQDFVINTSSYAPAPNEQAQHESSKTESPKQQLYTQPQLTSQLLSRIASANSKILQSLKLTHQHPKSLPFKPTQSSTLLSLAEAGAEDPQIAVPIFNALWKEITQPKASDSSAKDAQRPPILVTMDGLDHWMGPSLYRNSDHAFIHSHQFTLVKQFLSLLFPQGQSNLLPSGGMVLAATSGSNSPDTPGLSLLLQQLSAVQAGKKITDNDFPLPTPYSKLDQPTLGLLKDGHATSITWLKGASKIESKGLLEYFARSGILQERITENYIGERWGLSGGGIIGELARLGKRLRV